MPAADDQREGGELDWICALPGFQNDRVNVSFDVVHGDQRNAGREGNGFCVSEPDQQRTREAGARRSPRPHPDLST